MTGCYVNTFLSPLSLERETECLKKVAQNDKEAKDELILHNIRLMTHVTKKYAVCEDEMEELISIGTIGLIKAVSSFKADYGNRFATFAIRCIENEILMHFRSNIFCNKFFEKNLRNCGNNYQKMNVNYVKNGKNEFKTTKKIDKSDNRK